jgi:hypothetical protein
VQENSQNIEFFYNNCLVGWQKSSNFAAAFGKSTPCDGELMTFLNLI